jgi:hypothetical protein
MRRPDSRIRRGSRAKVWGCIARQDKTDRGYPLPRTQTVRGAPLAGTGATTPQTRAAGRTHTPRGNGTQPVPCEFPQGGDARSSKAPTQPRYGEGGPFR